MPRTQKLNPMLPVPRALAAAAALVVVLATGVGVARAAELIPSIGVGKALNETDATRPFVGVALRTGLVPFVKTELGVAYRSESRFDDQLTIRMFPVTGSLWFSPLPTMYAGGGVGWYPETYSYDQAKITVPAVNETKQAFGFHVGGGMRMPIPPVAAIDLNARYVMMRPQDTPIVPEKFSPDFWTASIGFSIHI